VITHLCWPCRQLEPPEIWEKPPLCLAPSNRCLPNSTQTSHQRPPTESFY